jgi:ribonuclease P protein component
MPKEFTLGKHERLKSRKQIEQLFKEGKSFALSPFRVYYLASRQSPVGSRQSADNSHMDENQKSASITTQSESGKLKTQNQKPKTSALQFSVGISGKNFSKAVDRNQIKRLTREAYRLQKSELQEKLHQMNIHLFLFFIYTAKEVADFQIIWEKTRVILKKLWKMAEENKFAAGTNK